MAMCVKSFDKSFEIFDKTGKMKPITAALKLDFYELVI